MGCLPTARQIDVLAYIMDEFLEHGQYPSVYQLATGLKVSPPVISRMLHRMAEHGMIEYTRTPQRGMRSPYRIPGLKKLIASVAQDYFRVLRESYSRE